MKPVALPKKFGRPSRLTAKLAKSIIASVESGLPKNAAAAAHGISKQLLQNWLDRGNKTLADSDGQTRDLYTDITLGVEAAYAQYQAQLLDQLHRSITDKTVDHRPLKTLLSVRFPADFTYQQQSAAPQSTGPNSFEGMTPEEATASVAGKLLEYIASADAEAESSAARPAESTSDSPTTGPADAGT